MVKEKNCFSCDKKFGLFTWRNFCQECGRMFCSDCIMKFDEYEWCNSYKPTDEYEKKYLCNTCWKKKIEKFHNKYLKAIENSDSVKTYPATYKGKIPLQTQSNVIEIESVYFKNRDNALKQLQVTSLIEGYNLIFNIEYEKKTRSEPGSGKGTHYYGVWKASGRAGKR